MTSLVGASVTVDMYNETACDTVIWSRQTTRTIQSHLGICILASVIHLLFLVQLWTFPTARTRSMLWVYAYLSTDSLLLIRFFLLYAYRWWPICMSHSLRILVCYFEAIVDNYLNQLQSYILLALNVCRYLQIAHGHNAYSANRCAIIVVYGLIYCLPLAGHIITILLGGTILQNPPGGICYLLPTSISIRALFLLFSYFLPVSLTLLFLALSLRHIRNTNGIHSQAIVDARQKYHRRLVLQSAVFYSLWLSLWSPHLLLFPFYCKNGTLGSIAQILSYINITLDPIVISALDRRFLQTWQLTGDQLRRYLRRQQSVRVPVMSSTHTVERTIEHSITIT